MCDDGSCDECRQDEFAAWEITERACGEDNADD